MPSVRADPPESMAPATLPARPGSASGREAAASRARGPKPAAPGTTLGPYRLHAELATGGMATVYLASRLEGGPESAVAIKRIHPHLAADRPYLEMFLDEVDISSRIAHPNVCRALEVREENGLPYLVMELLRGQPLSRVIKELHRNRVVPPAARVTFGVRLAIGAARGLHAAHVATDETGQPLSVVHRDISPHNLFVTYDGVCRILDFGVAKAERRLHRTAAGIIKGKLGYMAPEQMLGRPVDHRADVFGLAVSLWELLAGKTLFRRATQADTVLAMGRGERPPLREIAPEVPEELEAILDRALAANPERRTSSAARFASELEGWLASLPPSPDRSAHWMAMLFPEEKASLDELLVDALPPAGEAREETTAASRVRRRLGRAPRRPGPFWWAVAVLVAVLLGVALGVGVDAAVDALRALQ
ncbi:MAG: serine/threonine-protein kinase [Sandaracinaceae bacterium]